MARSNMAGKSSINDDINDINGAKKWETSWEIHRKIQPKSLVVSSIPMFFVCVAYSIHFGQISDVCRSTPIFVGEFA